MNRFDYAKQFSDKEKLAYFEKKIKEEKDFSKAQRYRVCAFNLRSKIEREKHKGKRK